MVNGQLQVSTIRAEIGKSAVLSPDLTAYTILSTLLCFTRQLVTCSEQFQAAFRKQISPFSNCAFPVTISC